MCRSHTVGIQKYLLVCSETSSWLSICSKHCYLKRRHQAFHWEWYRYHFRSIFYPLNACNPWSPEITAPLGSWDAMALFPKNNFNFTACTVLWACESCRPKYYHFTVFHVQWSHHFLTIHRKISNHLLLTLSGLSHFLFYYSLFLHWLHQLHLWWWIIDFNHSLAYHFLLVQQIEVFKTEGSYLWNQVVKFCG